MRGFFVDLLFVFCSDCLTSLLDTIFRSHISDEVKLMPDLYSTGRARNRSRSLSVAALRFGLQRRLPHRQANSHRIGDRSTTEVGRTDEPSSRRHSILNIRPFRRYDVSYLFIL